MHSLLALASIRLQPLAVRFKDFRNFQNGVPIAIRRWNSKEFLDLSEVTDGFHFSSIKTQNELVLDRDDFEYPPVICGQTERKRRWRGKSFRQNVHEPGYVRVRSLVCKGIL